MLQTPNFWCTIFGPHICVLPSYLFCRDCRFGVDSSQFTATIYFSLYILQCCIICVLCAVKNFRLQYVSLKNHKLYYQTYYAVISTFGKFDGALEPDVVNTGIVSQIWRLHIQESILCLSHPVTFMFLRVLALRNCLV